MRFYDCATAPSPRRVRIFIAEKGLEIETVEVDLMNRAQLEDDFKAINPWRTIPVLELDDGTLISESIACCRYLEEAYPEPPLMGRDPKEKAIIAMWEHRMEWDGLLAGAEYLRNTVKRMEGRGLTGPVNHDQIPELAERGKKRVAHFQNFLNERLGESEYVATDYYTVADITAQISLDFTTRMGLPWDETVHTNTARWYELVNARPSAKLGKP